MLTDQERAALVDELARESCNFGVFSWDGETPYMRSEYIRKAEAYLMPIIERLLAERDVDALMDSVQGDNMELSHYFGLWKCVMFATVGNVREQVAAYGDSPMAAIAAAVAQAQNGAAQ